MTEQNNLLTMRRWIVKMSDGAPDVTVRAYNLADAMRTAERQCRDNAFGFCAIWAKPEDCDKPWGQVAYEAECEFQPTYDDGSPRKPWAKLSDIVKDSWHRNPTPRWMEEVMEAMGNGA